MQKYLLCQLDSDSYSYADFTFCDSIEAAEAISKETAEEYFPGGKWENLKAECVNGIDYRIDIDNGWDFVVNYLLPIDTENGKFAVVYHHAYDGIEFSVLHQSNSIKSARMAMKYHYKKMFDELSGFDGWEEYSQMGFDDGNEWNVFDIVEITNQ